VLKSDEILERIIVPAESAGMQGEYKKLKRINGTISDRRRRDGPRRQAPPHCGQFRRSDSVLVDSLAASASADEAVAATLAAVSPISDVRCTKEYRLS